MVFNSETAEQTARKLLETDAIRLQPEHPFTWASGLHSPIYCDNRRTLSYPAIRTYIRQELSRAIKQFFENVQLIAGVATAGIPQGVLVAQELDLPFIYVRSSAKNHGLTNQIEGHWEKGQTAVVVEDLVSTGKSSLAAVKALREAGIRVAGMVSVFTYDLPVADENFRAAQCKLISLSDYHYLIQTALEENKITKKMINSLQEWRKDPEKWSQIHS